jgi:hypothetical protein
MTLFIGTVLLCLGVLWFTALLIGGRNPQPSWWAGDWILADVQVPLMMLLVVIGLWSIFRSGSAYFQGTGLRLAEILAALAAVAATGLVIRKMKVGQRLRQYAEMEADAQTDVPAGGGDAQMICLYRKLPWQVRWHLADNLGYDLNWIRTLRCCMREMESHPGRSQFLVFNPEQIKSQPVDVGSFDSLASHPEAVIFSGTFTAGSHHVSIDAAVPRRVA